MKKKIDFKNREERLAYYREYYKKLSKEKKEKKKKYNREYMKYKREMINILKDDNSR